MFIPFAVSILEFYNYEILTLTPRFLLIKTGKHRPKKPINGFINFFLVQLFHLLK